MFSIKEFFSHEVKPAMGCTDPGAVALAVAGARNELEEEPCSVRVELSTSIYKNGMFVGIPGVKGKRGNEIAAALGTVKDQPRLDLEVLKNCTDSEIDRANLLLEEGRVRVVCLPEVRGVYVHATLTTPNHVAEAVVAGDHCITEVRKDGNRVFFQSQENGETGTSFFASKQFAFSEIFEAVEEMNDEERTFALEGVRMNRAAADYGVENRVIPGANLTSILSKRGNCRNCIEDPMYSIRTLCTAAAGTRMAGISMPIMSSGGSGNQGIVATLPVAIAGEYFGKSDLEVAKAVTVSHIVSSYIKSKLGKLSPICGCPISAGPGAAAGITYLLDGKPEQMVGAMKFVIASTAGAICDGAKESCAIKAGVAGQEAYIASILSLENEVLSTCQGLVDISFEKTIDNLARISNIGMKDMDNTIISILENRTR